MDRIAQLAQRHQAQPLVILRKNERLPARSQRIPVALFEGFRRFAPRHAQVLSQDRQISACRKPHQIDCIRRRKHFVKIVDAPDEPPFQVPPRPKVFYVQVAHSQNFGSLRELAAHVRPQLQPPVESRAEERKSRLRHELMFEPKVLLDDWELCAQPLLEFERCLNNAGDHSKFTRARVPRERFRAHAIHKSGSAQRIPQPAYALSAPFPRRPYAKESRQSTRRSAPSPLPAFHASLLTGFPAGSRPPSSAAADRTESNSYSP